MKINLKPIAICIASGLLVFAPFGTRAAEGIATAVEESHREAKPPAAGEIVKLTEHSIEIKDHAGNTHSFAITEHTKFGTKHKAEKLEDFKVGHHVLVSYAEVEGKKTAHVIRELPPHHHGLPGAKVEAP
ncbi:MAG: hypothetical protein KGS60_16595 [Verrucomicrobia bacterium]|nr:hypothetical protein [Verrucomicrobiota bacterium]